MKNRRLTSPALASHLELVGSGLTFTRAMRSAFEQATLFENFTPADVTSISTYMHACRASKGATIFHEGEANGYLCILAEGLIGVYRKDEAGNLERIKSVQPGGIIGKTSLIDDLPYSASFIAESNCMLFLMSRENFRLCVDRNPALAVRMLLKIAQSLSLRLRQASQALAECVG